MPSSVVTKDYVDSSIFTLQNSDIPSQLNSSLDTILEIDNYITNLNTTVNSKANQTDLNATNNNVTSNTNSINNINSQISTINSTVSQKSNAIDLTATNLNVSNLTTTVASKVHQSSLDTTNTNLSNLSSRVGSAESNISSNTSNITSNTNSITSILSRLTTDESNITNNSNSINSILSRLTTDESNITSNTNSITSLQSSKADKNNTTYSNTYYVNAGVNLLSSVLSSIGTNQGQSIIISAGTVNDASGVSITVPNLTIQAPDSAFSSSSTLLNGTVTISGSTNTRCRISNIQFTNDVIINGTQGRHNFKACNFNGNFSLQGSTTNWINCYYCTFSGQVNIPNTYAGYIIFYFCDFNGATLNFSNLSNQQIYINSCVNLSSLSLNATLAGFNSTTTSSAVNSVTLNVSGSSSFPSGSIASTSINNTSFVDLSGNQTISGTKTINN